MKTVGRRPFISLLVCRCYSWEERIVLIRVCRIHRWDEERLDRVTGEKYGSVNFHDRAMFQKAHSRVFDFEHKSEEVQETGSKLGVLETFPSILKQFVLD